MRALDRPFAVVPAVSTAWCTVLECQYISEHQHCAACGLVTYGLLGTALCSHHGAAFGDGWAAGNRLMCDFLHRKKQPPPVTFEEPVPVEADVA